MVLPRGDVHGDAGHVSERLPGPATAEDAGPVEPPPP